MNKETIIRKLTSRKLCMAIALFVSGCFTAAGHADDGRIAYGLIMQAAAVIGYILGEGLIDAARIGGEYEDGFDGVDFVEE